MRRSGFVLGFLALLYSVVTASVPGGVTGLDIKARFVKSGHALQVSPHGKHLPGHLIAVVDQDRWGTKAFEILTVDGLYRNLVVQDGQSIRPLRQSDLPVPVTPVLAEIIVNGGKGADASGDILVQVQRSRVQAFKPNVPFACSTVGFDFQKLIEGQVKSNDLWISPTAAWDASKNQMVFFLTGMVGKRAVMAGRYRMDANGRVLEKEIGPL